MTATETSAPANALASDDLHPINKSDWFDAYPPPRDRSSSYPLSVISVHELADRLDRGQKPGRDLLVVDVRRTDCTVGKDGHGVSSMHSPFMPSPRSP